LHALLFAIVLKAATVIVWGDAIAPHPQDLVLVGVGTGVAVARIDAEHYAVVTAAHVARYGNPRIALYAHRGARPRVEMAALDPDGEDLAILIVRTETALPVVPLAQRNVQDGDRLTVVGHPYAQTWSVSHAWYEPRAAALTALQPLVTAHTDMWLCRGCDRGNSGSGIFDAAGRLQAVIYAAAPMPGYRHADERELRRDTYNPRIMRQVLAINAAEVRTLLRFAERSWRNKGHVTNKR
jgi:S1-C subfamily serine protease